jgi:hypothetical protein
MSAKPTQHLIYLAILIIGGLSNARSGQAQTVLQGTVTDRNTGNPIAGVAVSNGGNPLATTDANGMYSLTAAELNNAASGGVYFQGTGYYANRANYAITASPTTLNATLLPGGAVLQGAVTDASTQAGIVGAGVNLNLNSPVAFGSFSNYVFVTTGSGGHYTVDSSQFYEAAATGFAVNSVALSASGYFNTSAAGFQVNTPFPVTRNFMMSSTVVLRNITIATNPAGLAIAVDSTAYFAPQIFQWTPSNEHTIATTTLQAATAGTQYAFSTWSDGGALSHTIVVPDAETTYAASFNTQYQLTTTVNPAAGGSITAGGWFNAGSSVQITATPNSGYQFNGFSGGLTGTTNPQTILLNAPAPVTANFTKILTPTSTPLLSSSNPSISGTSVSFTATVNAATTPTGSVTFYDGANTLGTVGLTGNQAVYTTSSFTVGTHSITAIYSGDTTYAGSTSQTLLQSVVVLQSGTILYGIVADRTTGQPIAGTRIFTSSSGNPSPVATSDANGNYSLTAAELNNNATGSLYFQASGYYVNTPSYTITANPTTLNVTLLAGGTILQGTVTDASTQAGIVGAVLNLDDNGNFVFPSTGFDFTVTSGAGGQYAVDSSQFTEGAAAGFSLNSGSVISAPGYLNMVPAFFQVAPPFPVTQNFTMTSTGVLQNITIATNPPGLAISVDGTAYVAPQTFHWNLSNAHTIGTVNPQSGTTGTQYAFSNWSNGGAIAQTIVTPSSNTTLTASFNTQYFLATAANPTNEGNVLPASVAYYNSGTIVNLSASANAGYGFTSWTGNVANPSSASTTVTMSAPQSVTANFAPTTQPPAITSAGSTAFTVGLAGSFTVTATGIPVPSLSESGVLPNGVTFNVSTGVLSGTPAAGTAGTYNITFTASNGVGSPAIQTFVLTVHLPVVASLTLNPTSVAGGATNSTGTVTLITPATGTVTQRTVTLSSSNTAAATVPASVTVAIGATSANFTVTSHVVVTTTTATIGATLNGGGQNAVLTVTPLPQVASVTLNPTSVPGGARNPIGTVTLNAPAVGTAAQRTVTLSSSNTAAATVAASVTVAIGATSANFTVTSHVVVTTTTATIGATLNGGGQNAVLTVTLLPQVASVTLNPTSVPGGARNSIGTVALNAPAVGTAALRTVTLLSDNTAAATVPASVTVAAGSTSANFTVTSLTVAATTTANISATLNGGTQSAALTVTPRAGVASLALKPTNVPGGSANSTATVTLNAPAAGTAAQRTVTLSSSNAAAATVPASVIVVAGANTATFTVTSHVVAAAANPLITATLNGSATATLTVNPLLVISLTLNPASVVGGSMNSTATVTLNGAGAGTVAQRTVSLSSSKAAAATVPTSIVVTAGATTATFTVTSHAVAVSTTTNITASKNGGAQAALLAVTP